MFPHALVLSACSAVFRDAEDGRTPPEDHHILPTSPYVPSPGPFYRDYVGPHEPLVRVYVVPTPRASDVRDGDVYYTTPYSTTKYYTTHHYVLLHTPYVPYIGHGEYYTGSMW